MNHPYTTDTSDEARAVQLEIIRQMTPERRAGIAMRMTNLAVWQSKEAIKRNYPDLSEEERKIKFIAIHYGKELAEQVRLKLQEQGA